MNEYFLSTEEYRNYITKLKRLEKKKITLGKILGQIMDGSGSFAAKTPGFSETEDQLAVIEKQINDLNRIISRAKIISDISELNKEKITVYTLVTVLDIDNNVELQYFIQYQITADLDKQKHISIATPFSPIGKALLGKKIGEEIEIVLPNKKSHLRILRFEKTFNCPKRDLS